MAGNLESQKTMEYFNKLRANNSQSRMLKTIKNKANKCIFQKKNTTKAFPTDSHKMQSYSTYFRKKEKYTGVGSGMQEGKKER